MPTIKIFRIPIILFSYWSARILFYRLRARKSLEAYQNKKMRKHLDFLRQHSPYFRDQLSVEPWHQLTPMTKTEMMQNFDGINTKGISKSEAFEVAIQSERTRDFHPTVSGVTVGLSSGTSGHRGLFLASPLEQWRYAGTALAKILPGFWFKRNRVALFLRANSNLYTSVRSFLLKFQYFDLFIPVIDQLQRLNQFDPTTLIAPPSVLRQLAEHKNKGRLLIRPRKIISAAEVLDPIDEKYIQNAFSQKVHQIYQATEGFLAATCRHGVLHLNEDLMIIEKKWVDRENGKFFPIITDFSRKTQPIVRYQLNDLLKERSRPCACGSPLTALEFIEGRSDDIFNFPASGKPGKVCVYPDFIRRAMLLASEQITDYRVVQKGESQIEVQLCSRIRNDKIVDHVRHEFARLSRELEFDLDSIDIQVVKGFSAPTDGKKLRRVVNAVPTNH